MNPWRHRWLRLGLCALLACALYLPGLGAAALWEPDEGRYAEIAREMMVSHDYVTPRADWVRYFEKPPLVYWLTAASIKLLGPNELAVRLPIAAFSIGEIVLTQALAETMCGAAVGVLAALALALSPLFFGFGRFLTLDPALAFFVTAGLCCYFAASRKAQLAAGRGWLYLGALMAGLGTLAKGPVALILIGLVAVAHLLTRRRGRELLQVPWLGCALVWLASASPWFILAARRNPGFLEFFFIHEHLERYTQSTEHPWGFYFFVPVVLVGMWPWIAFIPGPGAWRSWPWAAKDSSASGDPQTRRTCNSSLSLLLCWFAVVLVFFSLPRSKLGSYILPGLPPLAILAGCGMQRMRQAGRAMAGRRLAAVALINVAVAGVALGAAFKAPFFAAWPSLRLDLVVAVSALAGLSLLGALASRAFGRTTLGLALLALGVTVSLGAIERARRESDGFNSYRALALAIRPALRPGCVLASYRHLVHSLPFYTGRREALVSYRGELAPFGGPPDAAASFIASDQLLEQMWKDGACVVLVVNRRDFPSLRAHLTPPPRLLAREGKKLAVTNLPAPPLTPAPSDGGK